jgi:electron transport complex protein RnfB
MHSSYPDIFGYITSQQAVVREAECIGCTKCIQACPVDAIIGAAKQMHTVISELCIGCGLCLPPCPVDCIDLITTAPLSPLQIQQKTNDAKIRWDARNHRLIKNKSPKKINKEATTLAKEVNTITPDLIQAAIARVLSKRAKQ